MKSKVIGIDLAKNVFQVCVLNEAHKMVSNRKVKRKDLLATLRQHEPTLIAMDACGTSNHWARQFQAMRHEVRLIPAQYVKPFVRRNKNDAHDALAICEAALRPGIHPVPVKTLAQQELQTMHRIRQRLVAERTALANQSRAILAECGIVLPVKVAALRSGLMDALEDADNDLTPRLREMLAENLAELNTLGERIAHFTARIERAAQADEHIQRLMTVPGYGPIGASALVATVGNARQFKNGRQMAACIGLTPRHVASGGISKVLSTSKAGNPYCAIS